MSQSGLLDPYQDENAKNSLRTLAGSLSIDYVTDFNATNLMSSFLKMPKHFIDLFLRGYSEKAELEFYNKLFGEDIDSAIKELLKKDPDELLIDDVVESLYENIIKLSSIPSPDLLDALFTKQSPNDSLFNRYQLIAVSIAFKLDLQSVIENNILSLSCSFEQNVA